MRTASQATGQRRPGESAPAAVDRIGSLPARGWVKVCGLREPEHAVAAATAGAHLLGFIFAPGRRRVTPEQAAACIHAARETVGGRGVVAVGVFVDAPVAEVNATADAAGLDLIQLHGEEAPESLRALRYPAIKALRPAAGATFPAAAALVDGYRDAAAPPIAFHLEGYSPLAAGGVGVRADWGLAARLAVAYPVVLAGGLDRANVGEAIDAVRPIGVDVSSGVESGGGKDARLIHGFVAAAREGFAAVADRREPLPP